MRIEVALCSGLFASALIAQTSCGHEYRPGLPFPGASLSVVCSTWWDPDGNGPQPGQLVVGGAFGSIGGVPAVGIASYDPAS